jgi:hypothetical protein
MSTPPESPWRALVEFMMDSTAIKDCNCGTCVEAKRRYRELRAAEEAKQP